MSAEASDPTWLSRYPREEPPGEWALRWCETGGLADWERVATVLAAEMVQRLQPMEARARSIADYAITEERRQVARHILTGEDG